MIKCFLDMDGVIVDFVGGACKLHGIPNPYPKHKGIWDFVELLDMSAKDFWAPMGEDFWANLEPTPDYERILAHTVNKFGEDNICILTSPCATAGCIEGKKKWIKKHLKLKHVLFGSSKHFLARPDAVLIDDAEHNVDPFVQHGGKGILLPRMWNKKHNISELAVEHLAVQLNDLES